LRPLPRKEPRYIPTKYQLTHLRHAPNAEVASIQGRLQSRDARNKHPYILVILSAAKNLIPRVYAYLDL
ncbi:MAG TPA: hypothetical protein VEW94_08415, partial [Chloroflexia bacterium]|nr:hypothetical protein [Chloroflexia bacterium]